MGRRLRPKANEERGGSLPHLKKIKIKIKIKKIKTEGLLKERGGEQELIE
jgi:hypothetical protein